MIRVWRARVEWWWEGKTEDLEDKPVPLPLCSSHISNGLTRARTRFSAVRGRRLTAWAIARPFLRFGSTSPRVRHYANRLPLDFSSQTTENERHRTQNPVNCKLPSYWSSGQHTDKSKSQNLAHTSVTRKVDSHLHTYISSTYEVTLLHKRHTVP
jgi:hypothetical protein